MTFNPYLKKTLIFSLFIVALSACSTVFPDNSKVSAKDSVRYLEPVFDKVAIEKDVFFSEVINYKGEREKLLLDVYSPSGDTEKNRAAIMWMHGGGFQNGIKEQNYIVSLATAMAKRGYVCFSISYRQRADFVNNGGPYIDAVVDALTAFNWIHDHSEQYRINKDRIAIGGGSAGGITAVSLCYGKDPCLTARGEMALIDLWGSPEPRGNLYYKVTKNGPPTLIINGTEDQNVPYLFSEILADELHKNGVYNVLHPLIGAAHTAVSDNPEKYINELTDVIGKFLIKVLEGESGPRTPNQISTYTVGGVGFQMNYVPGGLTFAAMYYNNNTKTITPTMFTVANAYWIAETEVTYQLWSAIYTWAISHGYTFADPGVKGSNGSGNSLQPVTTISWRDAMIWCNALTEYCNAKNNTNYACVYCTDLKFSIPIRSVDNSSTCTTNPGTEDNPCINQDAKGFRLPTTIEWELAARYIGTTIPTGSPLATQAKQSSGLYWTPDNYASGATDNYKNAAATAGMAVYGADSTAVVKSKNANALGLYDMSGNVREFCSTGVQTPGFGLIRVTHGGGYFDDAYFLQIGVPGICFPCGTYSSVGFRPVRTQ
jgi:predicted esterase